MTYTREIDDKWIIPIDRFNNSDYIDKRVLEADKKDQVLLRAVLDYLYNDGGTTSLAKNKDHIVEKYLDESEKLVAKWLRTRTNGRLKSRYGKKSLIAARYAKYRCVDCEFSDVRCLELDHIERENPETDFNCLCANCHNIKSREVDW